MTNGSQSWVEEHRPSTWDQIQGHNKALRGIKKWARNWSPGDNALLLHGPPGTGKTTTAYLVADELDAPLNEINASSARKKKDVERIAGEMDTAGVDSKYQVILLDEVDSWHHAANPDPIGDKLSDLRNPVVMTANDKYEVPSILKRGRYVDAYKYKLGKRSRKAKVKKIAKKEGLDLDSEEIDSLADRPDLRSAINDLQLISEGAEIFDDQREWKANKWERMTDYLMGDPGGIEDMTDTGADDDPASVVHWIDENLPEADYEGLSAGVAYDCLSRADIQLGRAHSSDYRSWYFAMELMKMIPDLRIGDPPAKRHWVDVNFPSWFKSKKAENAYHGEYELFKTLKDMEDGSYQFSGDFSYFRECILPILKSLSEEERYNIALSHTLEDKAVEALGIDHSDYEGWLEQEAPETGEWTPPTEDAMGW